MMKVAYKRMSLFDAPPGACLVHACNAKGVWGSGIAAEFKKRFPKAHVEYRDYCLDYLGQCFSPILGTGPTFTDGDYLIGCLITSNGYGRDKGSPQDILSQTAKAIDDFMNFLKPGTPIYSCKFNSGLFRVPWHQSEEIILNHLGDGFNETVWTVCDPSLPL